MVGYTKLNKEHSGDLFKVEIGEEIHLPFENETLLVKCTEELFGSKLFYSRKYGKYLIAIWNLENFALSNFLVQTKKEFEDFVMEAALFRGGFYEGYLISSGEKN